MNFGNPLINWQADEFPHYDKNFGWYLTLVILVALLVSFFILVKKDIFGGLTFIVLGAFIWIFSKQKPDKVNIELTDKGIGLGNAFIPYQSMLHFWIVTNNRHRTLNIETNAYFNKVVIIELEEQNPEVIRELIGQYVSEHERIHETWGQRLMHHLRF